MLSHTFAVNLPFLCFQGLHHVSLPNVSANVHTSKAQRKKVHLPFFNDQPTDRFMLCWLLQWKSYPSGYNGRVALPCFQGQFLHKAIASHNFLSSQEPKILTVSSLFFAFTLNFQYLNLLSSLIMWQIEFPLRSKFIEHCLYSLFYYISFLNLIKFALVQIIDSNDFSKNQQLPPFP